MGSVFFSFFLSRYQTPSISSGRDKWSLSHYWTQRKEGRKEDFSDKERKCTARGKRNSDYGHAQNFGICS